MKIRTIIVLAGILAAWPGLAAEEPVILENAFLRVSVRVQDGTIEKIAFLPSERTCEDIAIREHLVLENGMQTAITAFAQSPGAASDRQTAILLGAFPSNPLQGASPDASSDIPYFRDDDTHKLRMIKTYRLLPDQPVLEVKYKVENTATKPMALCLKLEQRFHKSPKIFLPTLEGAAPSGRYEYDMAGAWAACLDAKGMFITEYEWAKISCLAGPGIVTTRVMLEPGASWETTARTYCYAEPFDGIAGFENGIATELVRPPPPEQEVKIKTKAKKEADPILELLEGGGEGGPDASPVSKPALTRKAFLPGKAIPLQLRSCGVRTQSLSLQAAAVHSADGEKIGIPAEDISQEPGKKSSIPLTFTPPRAGTWLLRVDYFDGAKKVASCEQTLVVDEPSGFYLPGLAVKGAKTGAEFDRYRTERYSNPARHETHPVDVELTETISVPHVTYARPLSGGPLRMLGCIPFHRARELVELKLRLDTEMDHVLVASRGYALPAGSTRVRYEGARTATFLPAMPDFEVRKMKIALSKNPEAILVAGVYWNWFPPEIQKEILRQTDAGAMLVLCPPMHLNDELKELCNEKEFQALGMFTAAFGRGKIVFFRADETPLRAPIFADYYGDRMEENVERLCRTLVSAARGRPPVEIAWAEEQPGAPVQSLRVRNGGKGAFAGSVELVARLKLPGTFPAYAKPGYSASPFPFYEETGCATSGVAAAAGAETTATLPLPALPNGQYRIFAILKDAKGKTIDWISRCAEGKPPLAVHQARIMPGDVQGLRCYRTNSIAVDCVVSNQSGAAPGDTTAFLRAEDISGRWVADARQPLVFQGRTAPVSFTVPLQRALHRFLVVRIGVEQKGRVVAEQRLPWIVARAPEREEEFGFRLLGWEFYFPHLGVPMTDKVAGALEFWPRIDIRGLVFGGYVLPGVLREDPFLKLQEEGQELKQEADKLLQEKLGGGGAGEADIDALEILGLKDDDNQPRKQAKPGKAGAASSRESVPSRESVSPRDSVSPRGPAKPAFIRAPQCFNDPQALESALAAMRKNVRESSAAYPQRILLVDEYSYSGSNPNACHCAHCRKAFREYLRKQYGTLAQLNREWGANLAAWDQAELYTVDSQYTPPEPQAWPQVVDTMRWKAAQMIAFSRAIAAEGKKIDPEVEFGYSGSHKMSLWNGYDFWEMAQVGNYHGVYRDHLPWQSFCSRPGAVFGWYYGYGKNFNPLEQRFRPWSHLFADLAGTGCWTETGYPLAMPDGRLHPGPREYFEALAEIHRGPSALLGGKKLFDGAAVHWSAPSFYVYGVENWVATKQRKRFKADLTTAGGVSDWPRKAGGIMAGAIRSYKDLSPRYLGYGDLEQGRFGWMGKPRIIFLPYAVAMSAGEARTLTEFVREGGILVGSANTATRTVHGYPLDQPLLDEVFGIRHTGPCAGVVMQGKAGDTTTQATLKLPGAAEEIRFLPAIVGPPNIEPVAAKACGRWGTPEQGGPVFLVNRFGKGTAIYLNMVHPGVNENTGLEPDPSYGPAFVAMIHWALDQAGLDPFSITRRLEAGRKILHASYRFQDGQNHYIGLGATSDARSPSQPPSCREQPDVQVTLKEPRHVYEMRTGKYLGQKAEFKAEFGERLALVYACLPYAVKGLAAPAQGEYKPGDLVSFPVKVVTEGEACGRHVIRVEITLPDGKLQDILGYNALAPKGEATVELPLAYNAPAGKWIVRLRDVATGVKKEIPFMVSR